MRSSSYGAWELLATDDYGTEISLDTLTYYFCTTGLYKVVITDEFKTGIDAIVGQIKYAQAPLVEEVTPPPTLAALAGKKSNAGKIEGIIVGIIGGVAVAGGVTWWVLKRRKDE